MHRLKLVYRIFKMRIVSLGSRSLASAPSAASSSNPYHKSAASVACRLTVYPTNAKRPRHATLKQHRLVDLTNSRVRRVRVLIGGLIVPLHKGNKRMGKHCPEQTPTSCQQGRRVWDTTKARSMNEYTTSRFNFCAIRPPILSKSCLIARYCTMPTIIRLRARSTTDEL